MQTSKSLKYPHLICLTKGLDPIKIFSFKDRSQVLIRNQPFYFSSHPVCLCVCVCVYLGSDHTVFPSQCFPDGTTEIALRCLCSHSQLPVMTRPPNRKRSPSTLHPHPLPILTPGPRNRHRCSRRVHHTLLLCSSGTPTTRPYLSHCHARSSGQSGATAARSQPLS